MKYLPTRIRKIFPALFFAALLIFSACSASRHAGTGNVAPDNEEYGSALGQTDSLTIARDFIDGCKFEAVSDYESAINAFRKVLQADPSNDAAMYELAKIYFGFNRTQDAEVLAKEICSKVPGNLYYQLLYGKILTYEGYYDEAAGVYNTVLSLDGQNQQNYYDLEYIYEKAGRINDAISTMERLRSMIGDDENLLEEEQRLYTKSGAYDKAIGILQKLIDANPNDPSYYAALADLYARQNELEKSSEAFHKMLMLDPDNADALLKEADMQQKSGDAQGYYATMRYLFADPNADIDREILFLVPYMDSISEPQFSGRDSLLAWTGLLTQAHPSDAKAFAIRGDFLYYSDQPGDARTNYRKSLDLRSDVFDVWVKMFYIDANLKNYDSLAAVTSAAIELYPSMPLPYYFNGLAENSMKQYDAAAKVLNSGLPYSIGNIKLRADMYTLLGDCYHMLKKDSLSDNAYDASLLLNPDNALTLNNYAYYLSLRNERLEKADSMSKRSIELEPDNASLEDTYAWILYKESKYIDARAWEEKALQHNGDKSGVILEHYGDILYKLGLVDDAVDAWKRAKALGEASELIDRKIQDRKLYE